MGVYIVTYTIVALVLTVLGQADNRSCAQALANLGENQHDTH